MARHNQASQRSAVNRQAVLPAIPVQGLPASHMPFASPAAPAPLYNPQALSLVSANVFRPVPLYPFPAPSFVHPYHQQALIPAYMIPRQPAPDFIAQEKPEKKQRAKRRNDGEERQTSNKIAKQQNVQSNKIDDQEAANILLQLQRRPDKQS